MNMACKNFTSSKVTKRDIGTKFVKSKIQVPVFLIIIRGHSVSHAL